MKLYVFYTLSHLALKEKWFSGTLLDDYEIVMQYEKQIGPIEKHTYRTAEFIQTMRQRVDFIIRAIEENWNGVFLFSDVDVQFFKPTKHILLKLISKYDLVIQRNSLSGELCPGFFVCRCNQKTLNLWREIRAQMLQDKEKDEQQAINHLIFYKAKSGQDKFCYNLIQRIAHNFKRRIILRGRIIMCLSLIKNNYRIKWRYLPMEFFCPGMVGERIWKPGIEFPVPQNIIMHHANWTVGVENKIVQLKYVRDVVNKRAENLRKGNIDNRCFFP